MYQSRACIQCSCHCSASAGGTKNSISICSNSSVRKTKLPGVISLRNDLPTWAIPKGGLRRAYWSVLKSRKMPCAVSGPQKDGRAGVLHGPDRRLEHQVELARVREVAVGVVARQLRGALPAADLRVVARARALLREVVGAKAQVAGAAVDERVGESGEVPRASQVRGCWMIAESSATTSSRSWIIAFHHSAMTLFLSRTP